MKRKLIVIASLIIFIVSFLLLGRLCQPKYQTHLIEGSMIREYYETEKNHEVIFVGDCEVYANFSPLRMYEKQGISAYVRGSSQQLIWQSYYLLEETFRYEKPRLVVLNVNAMRYGENVSDGYNHLMVDYMPMSVQKLQIIKSSKIEEGWLDYLVPLIRYHDRLFELDEEDTEWFWKTERNSFNGFLVNKEVKPVGTLPAKRPLTDPDFADICYEYLDRITELCRNNGVDLLLIKAPSLYPYWYDEYEQAISRYASEKGIGYLNLLELAEEIGIDYQTDTYDAGLHLNLYGAEKLSDYFADYLKKNYQLTDYRGNEKLDKMLEEYIEYID